MAKKKSKVAKYRSKRKPAKRAKNPATDAATKAATDIGAGFAGYATTRFVSRIAYSQSVKRNPKLAPHIHAAASVAGAAGVYFGSKYWSKTEEHHEAIALGAGIAMLQTIIQTYVPKFGWIVGDVRPEQYVEQKPGKKALPAVSIQNILPDDAPSQAAALPAAEPDSLSDSDIEAMIAGDDSLEAVPIGQAPPTEDAAANASVFDEWDDSLEHYNGMIQ